jgi:hypothetical protein
VEWLYRGLPAGESIPWRCWVRPYLYWASMGLMLYGLMFALCVLLREQWAEREMLPFPLAEIPREMIVGRNEEGIPGQAFLKDKAMWLGFGAVFLFHSWNMMLNYIPEWPVISISSGSFGEDYLTEKPWSALRPMQFIVLPSVIAVTYLVGKEIGFSLWFFYAVLKIGVLIMVGLGYGSAHHDFTHTPDHWRGTFINQGMGALIGWAFVGFWAARGPLKSSLLRALKKKGDGEAAADASLRSTWLLLATCFCGSVGWLTWMNVRWSYAFVAVCALMLVGVTVARMASEGGIFKPEIKTSPVDMTLLVFPPAIVEPASLVPLSMWSRLTMFDQFRISPMVSLITALQVGALTGLRRRSLHLGMCLALVTAFGVSFFSFLGTLYHEPEASGASWIMEKHPMYEFKRIAGHVGLSETRSEKLAEAKEKGLVPDELPPIHGATRDRTTWTWLGLGAALTTLFFWLRTRLFWWPHPAGYAFWAGQSVYNQLWFSFLLGWLFKVADLRFGGMKAFQNRRRFFIGVIVGEAFSAVFWILINWASETTGGYKVWICRINWPWM